MYLIALAHSGSLRLNHKGQCLSGKGWLLDCAGVQTNAVVIYVVIHLYFNYFPMADS